MSGSGDAALPAQAALVDVTAAIRTAQQAVDRGDFVDLTGLDAIVAGLCAGIRRMPSVQGRQLAPQLAEMIEELSRLAAAMEGQRDRWSGLGREGGRASSADASAAYRKRTR